MKTLNKNPDAKVTGIILVSESRILREGLTILLRKQADFHPVDSTHYSASTFKFIASSDCDVLLADQASAATFPSNFIADLLSLCPGRKAVLFGMENDPDVFLRAVKSGVSGYLLEDASSTDIIDAIRKVVAGEAVSPPCLCHHLFQSVARGTREGSLVLNQRLCHRLGLTARQQQLIALLARGFTNKEIAGSLCLSEFTVKNHIRRIMRRLNAENRYAAVQAVCESNLPASI